MAKKELNKDEKNVLKHLMEDARQSPYQISKKCGFSRQKAWRIIKKLEKEKVLWGYYPVVDPEYLGMNMYFALSTIKEPFYPMVETIIQRVKAKHAEKTVGIKLLGFFYVNGPYDYISAFIAPSLRDAKKFCLYLQKEYADIIDKIILLETIFPLLIFAAVNPDINQFKEFTSF